MRVLFSVGTPLDIIYFRTSGDILVFGNPLSKHSWEGQWLPIFSQITFEEQGPPWSVPFLTSTLLLIHAWVNSCLSLLKLFEIPQMWNVILPHHTLSQPGTYTHPHLVNSYLSFRIQVQYPSLEICPTCASWAGLPTPSSTSLLFYWPLGSAPSTLSCHVWFPATNLPWFMMGLCPDKSTLNWKCRKSKCI